MKRRSVDGEGLRGPGGPPPCWCSPLRPRPTVAGPATQPQGHAHARSCRSPSIEEDPCPDPERHPRSLQFLQCALSALVGGSRPRAASGWRAGGPGTAADQHSAITGAGSSAVATKRCRRPYACAPECSPRHDMPPVFRPPGGQQEPSAPRAISASSITLTLILGHAGRDRITGHPRSLSASLASIPARAASRLTPRSVAWTSRWPSLRSRSANGPGRTGTRKGNRDDRVAARAGVHGRPRLRWRTATAARARPVGRDRAGRLANLPWVRSPSAARRRRARARW